MQKGKGKKEMAKRSVCFNEKSLPLFLIFTFCLLIFSACVPVPPELMPQAPGAPTAQGATYPDLDPGGTSITSLHFTLKGYNETELHTISSLAEDIYNKIGMDTGLYSYLAGQNYIIVVYKDQTEYTTKTKQNNLSRVVVGGNALYTYSGPDMDAPLAHQMVHLIMNAYMGDKANSSLKWLVEGLAMHEELIKMTDADRAIYQTSQASNLRRQRMPFAQMTFFVTANEDKRRDDSWYQQVESVVSFMLKQGSNLAFAAFLESLRNGKDLDSAISDNYPGKYRGQADLEQFWISTI